MEEFPSKQSMKLKSKVPLRNLDIKKASSIETVPPKLVKPSTRVLNKMNTMSGV